MSLTRRIVLTLATVVFAALWSAWTNRDTIGRLLCYGRSRKYMLKIAGALPPGKVREAFLDWLYPSDARITFK